jgi:bifunctional DNase/RNase
MVSLLAAGELHLERVIIHAIEDSTFRAVLKLSHDAPVDEMEDSSEDSREDSEDCEPIEEQQTGDDLLNIDARPSDAIALAIRTGSSIWMLEEVVAEASIAVDAEADAEDRNEFRRFLDQVSPAAMVRHLQSRQPKDEETNDDSPLE